MSDLQCPARIFLAREGDVDRLAAVTAPERIAATYDAPVDLEDLADRYRGEAVVVLGEHGYGDGVVLLEIDGDGTRVTRNP